MNYAFENSGFAASCRALSGFSATPFSSLRTRSTLFCVPRGQPSRESGPGLGVDPREEVIGRRAAKKKWDDADFGGVVEESMGMFPDPLGTFADAGYITDVVHRAKSRKEAAVYCCRAHSAINGGLVAAKVYAEQSSANCRTRGQYADGQLRMYNKPDPYVERAIKAKGRFGRRFIFEDWVAREYANLNLLHRAGADIGRGTAPTPRSARAVRPGDAQRGAVLGEGPRSRGPAADGECTVEQGSGARPPQGHREPGQVLRPVQVERLRDGSDARSPGEVPERCADRDLEPAPVPRRRTRAILRSRSACGGRLLRRGPAAHTGLPLARPRQACRRTDPRCAGQNPDRQACPPPRAQRNLVLVLHLGQYPVGRSFRESLAISACSALSCGFSLAMGIRPCPHGRRPAG